MMRRVEREQKGSMKPGQDLVLAGYAGLEGSRKIARLRREELLNWFSREYVEQMEQETDIRIEETSGLWQEYGATEWEEVKEGGIFTALWNLSGAYGLGFVVDLYRIPIRQETIEVCERYDLNPYRLYSSCILVATDNGDHLVSRLSARGFSAAVIGVVMPGIKREICYGQVRGFLERPRRDELYKVTEGDRKS